MTRRAKPERDHEPGSDATAGAARSTPAAHHLLALGGSAGNLAVQRALDTADALREMGEEGDRRTDTEEGWQYAKKEGEAGRTALALKELFDGRPDKHEILRLLSGHEAGIRRQIQDNFKEVDGRELPDRLKEVFRLIQVEEELVKAWALLSHAHYHDYHVAVALALIPRETRDKELFRLLEASAKANTQQVLRREYDRTYADLGQGSLEADLAADLADDVSGLSLQKAKALLDHKLSDAERLYLMLWGLPEEGATALGIIEAAWGSGPAAFHNLKTDWDYLVVGKNGWTNLPLWGAMEKNLRGYVSDDHWYIANRIWNGYEAFRKGLDEDALNALSQTTAVGDAATASLPVEEQDRILQVQIDVEMAMFKLVDPETGKANDETRYFGALERIQNLTQRRITLARSARREDVAAELEQSWKAQKQSLLASAGKAFDVGSRDYMRARLLLEGNLNWGDKVWLKAEDKDYPGIIALVTQAWAAQETDKLIGSCQVPRTGAYAEIIRDVVPLPNLVSGGLFGNDGEKVRTLIAPGDDVTRGRARLAEELGGAKSDASLRGAYQFLTTPGISKELREATIDAYVRYDLGAYSPEAERVETFLGQFFTLPSTPVERFLNAIEMNYRGANTVWDFYDLLAPSQDIDEIVRRAEKRTDIATKGFSAGLAQILDFGGEDAIATTRESMERLQYLRDQGLSGGDIQLLLDMMGKKTTADLAGVEYEMLQERVKDALAARAAATDTFVSMVEFAVEAALSALTGGAPLIAGLGATLAGIGTRRAIEGPEYDPIDKAQLLSLVSPDLGSWTGPIGEALGEAKFWHLAGRAAPVLKATAADLVDKSGEVMLGVILEDKWPDAKELAAMVVSSAGGAWAGEVSEKIQRNIKPTDDYLRRAELIVKSKMYSSAIGNTTGLLAKVTGGAMDDKTMLQIGLIYGEGLGKSQIAGLYNGLLAARESLISQEEEDEFNAGVATAEGTPLGERAGFEAEDLGDDPTKKIPVNLKLSGQPAPPVEMLVSASGDADFQVETTYGRMPLRDVLLNLKPGAEASETTRKTWFTATLRLTSLEDAANSSSDDKIAEELERILYSIEIITPPYQKFLSSK
jgi:hypothetical protein